MTKPNQTLVEVFTQESRLIPKLAKLIDSHDNCMFCREESGKLIVASLVSKDGKASMHRETIEPTLQAVRDWLGY